MIPTTDENTEEARSLQAVDGRAVRTESVKEERWAVVEVLTTAKEWTWNGDYPDAATCWRYIDEIVKQHGRKWRKQLRAVEVVAVARTETVTTRTVCSPIDQALRRGEDGL